MSRLLSIERARTALHLLIVLNVLIYAYRDNFRPQLGLRQTYRAIDGNVRSMVLSIFYHTDPSHLFVNMMTLYRYGSELFLTTSSMRWRSMHVIVLSYLICGMGAFVGIELLSRYHVYQWERKVKDAREASRCSHWFCGTVKDYLFGGADVASLFTNAWADLTTTLEYADVRFSMWYYQMIYRIGASGVVYGWIGMRIITSWLSPYHSQLNVLDYVFLSATIAHDVHESALTLDDLRSFRLLEGDGIDHTAHVMGVVSGMIWAMALIVWEKLPSLQWKLWGTGVGGGEGRRLGSRLEEEQRIQEQQRQRVQSSRLLNSESGSSQRPSPLYERTRV